MPPAARDRPVLPFHGHGALALMVPSPADRRTFQSDATGVQVPGAEAAESGALRRRQLAEIVVHATPADRCAVFLQPACVGLSRSDGLQGRGFRRRRLPLLIVAPADGCAVSLQRACVRVAGADCDEPLVGRGIRLIVAVLPPAHGEVVISEPADMCRADAHGGQLCVPRWRRLARSVVAPAVGRTVGFEQTGMKAARTYGPCGHSFRGAGQGGNGRWSGPRPWG